MLELLRSQYSQQPRAFFLTLHGEKSSSHNTTAVSFQFCLAVCLELSTLNKCKSKIREVVGWALWPSQHLGQVEIPMIELVFLSSSRIQSHIHVLSGDCNTMVLIWFWFHPPSSEWVIYKTFRHPSFWLLILLKSNFSYYSMTKFCYVTYS